MANFLRDYEPVEDRLRRFWSDHPEGRIETELVSHADGSYIVRAMVWRDDKELLASSTGLAQEQEDRLPANMKDSALEVCETSAIGRALANLGYAPKGKRPSREEMSAAAGAADTPGPGDRSPLEDISTSTPPASGTDVDCDHHYPTGVPAKAIKGAKLVCRLCGMDWVSAMEGTTADLGGP